MRTKEFVIEARYPDGSLALREGQPEAVFGLPAIHGITADEMAQVILRHKADAILSGDEIATWPALLNPLWQARRKTW